MSKARPIIALDADGVLLDYNLAYAGAWKRAFGQAPTLVAPQAYWPMDRWGVPRLDAQALEHFRKQFDGRFWSTIPAITGAVDACHQLVAAGYELVCVTALEPRHADARRSNLLGQGFPIEHVVAVEPSSGNPKASALAALGPVAMVDDYLPYLVGLPAGVHAALVERQQGGSPNTGPLMSAVHSRHADLVGFVRWWLTNEHAPLEK